VNRFAVTSDRGKFLLLDPQKDYFETYSVILTPQAVKWSALHDLPLMFVKLGGHTLHSAQDVPEFVSLGC